MRPHLDYGDIIYHRCEPDLRLDLTKRLEQTQYSAVLAVTGAWRGISRQRQRRKNTANLQTWFGGRYWPKIEEGFVVKNKILLC